MEFNKYIKKEEIDIEECCLKSEIEAELDDESIYQHNLQNALKKKTSDNNTSEVNDEDIKEENIDILDDALKIAKYVVTNCAAISKECLSRNEDNNQIDQITKDNDISANELDNEDANVSIIGQIIEIRKNPLAIENEDNENCVDTKDSNNLNNNLKVPTVAKPYGCGICNRYFSDQRYLKRHSIVHTGGKLYECNACHKKFLHEDTLEQHLRMHIGDKSYECGICQKRFGLKRYLRRHLIVHATKKTHECNICHKKYAFDDTLKRHLRIHNDDKPYECDICSKRFARNDHLKRHLKVHSGTNTLTTI